ncbi:glycosyltransferase family 2 protein [Thalassotalea euphylliae]|uniref:glycosyltransferase family 2 protein n=1 Tax=Thalassotalea euphylliae TaxID=1655234 RepID=UPI0015F29E9D|nr:glycosyltransferase family 2 protein [Thalassotalea euphylliae]
MLKISVIIPYYQRQEGTLHRTLASIASQSALPCITEVIVIDDGSPIPAESELSALPEALSNKLRVIKQENAGVSKARNKGLDSVADGIDIVAFLDSDDNWQQGHIQHMVQAFENGADFYFANFCQLNQDIDAFSRGGRMQLHEHAALTDILHTYQGDMSTQILTGNLIGTSTVGYRFTKYQSNRFREDLKFAGEDYLFWLEIALSNPSIMFTSTVQVVYGEGVNIFSSAQWGTTHLQQRLRDEIFFRSSTLKDYPVAEQTEQELTKRLKENCKQFFSNAKSCLKHGEISAMFIVLSTVVKKPSIIWLALQKG